MIENIEITKLEPHPQNPRIDLGDLAELAESIKENGILQNLTVVPRLGEITGEPIEGLYRVVIGHRRLAAAKIAGLTVVPCVIADMDESRQIAAMMLENMARNDLTLVEQARGIQMMMDLGDSVKDIADKTGFSEATVYRRANLLKLDQEKFKESAERGATLMDFIELDQVKDIDRRNALLDSIGTNNFDWRLKEAIRVEKWEEDKEKIVEALKSFAEEIQQKDRSWEKHRYINRWSLFTGDNIVEIPEDADTAKYYFFIYPDTGSIELVKLKDDPQETTSETMPKSNEYQEKRKRLDMISAAAEAAYELRRDFVKNCKGIKKNARDIMMFAAKIIHGDDDYVDDEELAKLFDVELAEDNIDEDDGYSEFFINSAISKKIYGEPEQGLLKIAWLQADNKLRYSDWGGIYVGNVLLDMIYELLTKLGYQMSDDEKALQDGTHELFIKEDEDNE